MSQHETSQQEKSKETQLLETLAETKRALKEERQRQREKAIRELGELAYKAGLHLVDRQYVQAQFLTLGRGSMVPSATGDGDTLETVSITSTAKAVTSTVHAHEKEYNDQNQ